MTQQPDGVGHFRVDVHRRGRTPLRSFVGTGDEWKARPFLSVSHQEDSFEVPIGDVWAELLEGSQNHIDRTIVGLCTIIKFGQTMQLREQFRVVIQIRLPSRPSLEP